MAMRPVLGFDTDGSRPTTLRSEEEESLEEGTQYNGGDGHATHGLVKHLAVLGIVAVVSVSVAALFRHPRAGTPLGGDTQSALGLQLMPLIHTLTAGSDAYENSGEINNVLMEKKAEAREGYKSKLLKQLKLFRDSLGKQGNSTGEVDHEELLRELAHYKKQLREKFQNRAVQKGWELPRKENITGQLCARDEEPFGGLCYKKCSILTKGEYPHRSSAFQCCETKDACGIASSAMTSPLKPCGGYSTSGDRMGGGCPHPPGTCLHNEEFSLGLCFKRCDILTWGEYPYRMSPIGCCKYNSKLLCMDPAVSTVSANYSVGGGPRATTPMPPVLPTSPLPLTPAAPAAPTSPAPSAPAPPAASTS